MDFIQENRMRSIWELICQLVAHFEQPVGYNIYSTLSPELANNRLIPVVYKMLCELKTELGLHPSPELFKRKLVEEVIEEGDRLDNVIDSFLDEKTINENEFYKRDLMNLKNHYTPRLQEVKKTNQEFLSLFIAILQAQEIRFSISQEETDKILILADLKLKKLENELKLIITKQVFVIKATHEDRRKGGSKKNFSKKAIRILEEYFHCHISNPYPSLFDKEKLAKKCKISLTQVSNWFANKRVRYRKEVEEKMAMGMNLNPYDISSFLSSAPSMNVGPKMAFKKNTWPQNFSANVPSDLCVLNDRRPHLKERPGMIRLKQIKGPFKVVTSPIDDNKSSETQFWQDNSSLEMRKLVAGREVPQPWSENIANQLENKVKIDVVGSPQSFGEVQDVGYSSVPPISPYYAPIDYPGYYGDQFESLPYVPQEAFQFNEMNMQKYPSIDRIFKH